jgi:hypothetical protein
MGHFTEVLDGQREINRLLAEIERLRAALLKVRYKAGSHTVGKECLARGEGDPGFAGIYTVANNALESK